MTNNQRWYLLFMKIGLCLVPFIPLIISGSILFPFITGKNFTFRILTELLLVLWIPLMVVNKDVRPRRTLITIFVTVLFVATMLGVVFGADPYKSFWSNYERMEGFLMHIHLYLYFLMLVSVMRAKKDWTTFLHCTLVASILLSIYGLGQKIGLLKIFQGAGRVEATIGNAAYFAAYLLFHIFLALYFFLQSSVTWKRIAYGAIAFFEFIILYYTATRGALLGFSTGIFVLLLFIALWGKRMGSFVKKLRPVCVALLVALVLFSILFIFVLRDASFVQKSNTLSRLASISLHEQSTSRFLIWDIALKGFIERPIFGWGLENFPLVFQKYYDPQLAFQEPWFDRSHNIIFDWLIHAGLLGALAYIGLFGAVLFLLLKHFTRQPIVSSVFSAALIAYGVQNMFVFDNLNTYLLFYAFLGFINWSIYTGEGASTTPIQDRGNQNPSIPLSGILLVIIIILGYSLHIKPIQQSRFLIEGLKASRTLNSEEALVGFNKALAYNSFGNTETREQLSNTAIQLARHPQVAPSDKKKLLDRAVEEIQKQTQEFNADARPFILLNSLYNVRAQILGNVTDLNLAEQAGLEALNRAPNKQQVYFELAQTYLTAGQNEQAFELAKKAYELYPQYRPAFLNMTIISIFIGREDIVNDFLEEYRNAQSGDEYMRFVNAYARINRFDKVLEFYQRAVAIEPGNVEFQAGLALSYAQTGNKTKALALLEELKIKYPQVATQLDQLISQIKISQ